MASFSAAASALQSTTSLFASSAYSSSKTSLKTNGSLVSLRRLQTNNRRLRISCEAAKPETVQKVIEVVTKQLASAPGIVQPHSKFQELGADSLDQVEIVMALEEEFKISVDEDGAESIITVQDAADLIEKAVAKA